MDNSRGVLVTGETYHIYSKSIAEFVIFNNDVEFSRIKETMLYYQTERQHLNFAKFLENGAKQIVDNRKLVDIICYCPMPTHLHLSLKQLRDRGISDFMRRILDSYTRYFNIKHNRKGPLWEGRFKRVLVESDEQLLHLTRYIHLNPPAAYLVNNPIDWKWSSYGEYVSGNKHGICKFDDALDIKPDSYKKFVEDRISYQRELARIKNLMLD
ncbi:MAG: transposase [Candidatus Omnitrophota bacterium]|nr:transposase [Candidatus Omnitrophota bacterium]